MPQIPFATQSYQALSSNISTQRLVNMYLETEPPDAKTQTPLIGSPGVTSLATLGVGPVRGMRYFPTTNLVYAVSANDLYSISSAGVTTLISSGGPIGGAGPVAMSDNGTQIMMVNGVGGFIYTVAGGFVNITDSNFVPSNTVTLFENYFVTDGPNTGLFHVSSLFDGTTWPSNFFGSANVKPGNVLATLNLTQQLLVFTSSHVEIWYNSGALNFPLARYAGAVVERGCAAAGTPIVEDNAAFFLGDDRIFYRLQGTIPEAVSTFAISQQWQSYSTVSDAFCFSYTVDGHKCVVVVFPTAQATWIYDCTTRRWHERESWGATNLSLGRWRANCAVSAFNKTLIGDFFSGNVGVLDPTTYTEYGNIIRGQAIAPYVHKDRKRVFFQGGLELDMETGVGLATGQGSNPQVMLDWSDDGGHTWSALQLWRSMGPLGDYGTRVRWTKLGQSRQRAFRINITDPVKRIVVGAYLNDLEIGDT